MRKKDILVRMIRQWIFLRTLYSFMHRDGLSYLDMRGIDRDGVVEEDFIFRFTSRRAISSLLFFPWDAVERRLVIEEILNESIKDEYIRMPIIGALPTITTTIEGKRYSRWGEFIPKLLGKWSPVTTIIVSIFGGIIGSLAVKGIAALLLHWS